jgi:hypothetical protein
MESKSKSAGCLFTNNKVVLGGFQPYKSKPCISGFGGKAKEGERTYDTAWRETLEELFGWKEVPRGLLHRCMLYEPGKKIESDIYVTYVYSFYILEKVLKEAKESGYESDFYTVFPETIEELILNREGTGEIEELCILPIKSMNLKEYIAEEFIEDIKALAENLLEE